MAKVNPDRSDNPAGLDKNHISINNYAVQRQTGVTAYLKSKQLLLFTFARKNFLLINCVPNLAVIWPVVWKIYI